MADAYSLVPQNILENPGLSQECRGLEFPDQDQQTSLHFQTQEEQTQKVTFVPESTNVLGEAEDEAGREIIGVPPGCGALIRGSPDTEIDFEASNDESHESMSRLSRIDSAKHDTKNLRSATLGRMGKIFKIRPPTPSEHEKANETERGINPPKDAASVEQQYGQDPTRKEKTHSLGRMLHLVDKDGAPRKLFSHTRSGSLTRLRKLQSTVGNVAAGSSDESRNIFTRMLNQFRGRNPSGTNAEPNLQSARGALSPPKPSLGTRLMMSLSARGSTPASPAGTEPEATVERVTVEYTA